MRNLVLAMMAALALGSGLIAASVQTSYGNPDDEKPKAGIETSQTQP